MSVSRREFASQMTGALSGAVAASLAATPAIAAMPQAEQKPAPASEPPAELSFEDHQVALLKELYKAPHLTDEMFKGIREGMKHNRGLAERIRKVPLTHDIPPAFQFVIPPA